MSQTVAQRLENLAARSAVQRNPMLPAIMHSLERYLAGATDASEIDQAVWGALKRRRGVTRDMVRSAVGNWKRLPRSVRARLAPAELLDLDPARKLDMGQLRRSLQTMAAAPVRAAASGKAGGSREVRRTALSGRAAISPRAVRLGSVESASGLSVIEPGKRLTLRGKFSPSSDGSGVEVRFYEPDPPGRRRPASARPPVATASPRSVGESRLDVTAPTSLRPFGLAPPRTYLVQVSFRGLPTNTVSASTPGLRLPELRSVTPERQYPGGSIVLSGVQFIPATQQRVRLEAVDDPSIVYDLTGTLQGFGKLRLTVAQKVVPGRYRIAIGGLPGGATAAVISNWKELEVRAPFYQMVYERIRCIDETDPEWPGDDEIVTLWAINADPNYTWIKQTGEYTDFSDGVSRDYDAIHRSVFNPEGHAQAVNRYLATATTLWEWDAGDASQAGEALSLAGDVVLGVGTAIGGWGAVVGVVADIVLDVVGALVVLFGGDPDFLGTHTAAWGAADLQLATAGTNSTAGTLTFTGSNGKYEVDYRVIRHQP